MQYTIENEKLKVVISAKGAEMQSIFGKTECREYLWQKDPSIWEDQALNIFPYIARLTEGKYTYDGKEYQMDIHGFLKDMNLEAVQERENQVRFSLADSEGTRKQYPFSFVCEVCYELADNEIRITYCVENKNDKTMYFGIGGHPGFIVPMEDGKRFEDYYLEFEQGLCPEKVIMSDDCFVIGEEAYQMEDGRYIRLNHHLFDHDAIVLKNAGNKVKLTSGDEDSAVTVEFPQMDYLGIWHKPYTEAGYVCLEPWTSLPSRKGVVEELKEQENLIALESGGIYENNWKIRID